jgi:hypothetical protein
MISIRLIFLTIALVASLPASAATMSFEDATTVLGASCGKDIDDNCRGVNLDPGRLRECLARNQDVVSPQCKADYFRIFDAIQKRAAARAAVPKMCDREAAKLCAGTAKEDLPKCLLAIPKGIGWKCTQAINEAGYRK